MSELKIGAASGGGSISIKGPASSGSDVDVLDTSGNLTISGTSTLTGNVGVGVSAAKKLHVKSTNEVARLETTAGTGSCYMAFFDASGEKGYIGYGSSGSNDYYIANAENANIHFECNGSERMRIASDGDVLIGCSSFGASGLSISPHHSVDTTYIVTNRNSAGTTKTIASFQNGGTEVGKIQHDDAATTYATSSDYRLKENQVAISDGITRLKTLKPYRFNFKVKPDKTVDGFFAHEAQAVVPEAVTGTKDEVDGDDKAVLQGIDQSKLVPLLTAALQEAITKIETLETKVAALEAG